MSCRSTFSAALCRGLIEAAATICTSSPRTTRFSAVLCRGLIEAPARTNARLLSGGGLLQPYGALVHNACRYGHSASYRRMPRRLTELAIASSTSRPAPPPALPWPSGAPNALPAAPRRCSRRCIRRDPRWLPRPIREAPQRSSKVSEMYFRKATPEHDVLVLGGLHQAAQRGGRRPELGLVAGGGAVSGRARTVIGRCLLPLLRVMRSLSCFPISPVSVMQPGSCRRRDPSLPKPVHRLSRFPRARHALA